MTITEFILARIAEDEAVAGAASPAPWQFGGVASIAGGTLYDATRRIADVGYEQPTDHDGTIVRHLLAPEADANGEHIVRHDPARVLAQCEAMRQIVELHPRCDVHDRPGDECDTCQRCGDGSLWPCDTLLALAAIWSDHPDYDEAWRA